MRRFQARPGRPRPRQSRNGHRAKTVITEAEPVEISVPRDRDSSFDPKIVAKRQRRLTEVDGADDMVISESGTFRGRLRAAGSRPVPVNRGDLSRRRPGMGRGRRDQALRRRLAVPWAAHRSARPRQAERPPAAGNPPPFLGLRAPPGSTGRLLQLAEPPHPRRVTPWGGKQQRTRDDLVVRSPDSSREILRAIGVDQHLRTSAPCRTVRLARHVPDLPTGELPLKLASALTVPHGLSPPSTLSNTPIPGHEYPPPNAPRQAQLTGACSRKPIGTRQALRRAAPGASDLFSGTAASPAPPRPWSATGKRGLSSRCPRPGLAQTSDSFTKARTRLALHDQPAETPRPPNCHANDRSRTRLSPSGGSP